MRKYEILMPTEGKVLLLYRQGLDYKRKGHSANCVV